MTSVSCLTEIVDPLVLDASVIVNLNATGFADRILDAIPARVLIPGPVVKELKRGTLMGHNDATDLHILLEEGVAETMNFPPHAHTEFIALVSGSSATSLGDGEAATIVSAYATGAWAAIDERKARRICTERYRGIKVASTVDILAHPDVTTAMTEAELSGALLAALEVAHMHVQKEHMDWILQRIDPKRVGNCTSLPRTIRDAYRPQHDRIQRQR